MFELIELEKKKNCQMVAAKLNLGGANHMQGPCVGPKENIKHVDRKKNPRSK